MTFLRLFNQTIVRDLTRNPVRTLLTFTGVALGIAVVVAVGLANDRAIGSFNESLELLNGQADFQLSANGSPLDESLIGELSWVWDVGAMTAIIEGRALTTTPGVEQESVRLFGADLLSDAPFRSYELDRGGGRLSLGVTRRQFIDLLTSPDAIVLPRTLAADWKVGAGDRVDLVVANRRQRFTVATVLDDTGIARAFNGRIVFMDIAAAQLAMDRFGEVDRIELVLDDTGIADAVAERLRAQLPNSVFVDRPEETLEDTARITRAFRYNLTALSYIALVVGMILIYNTLNIAVVRRHAEIGTLRTLGASRRTVGWMFLTEAVAFGVAGGAAGVWFGSVLAGAAGALVSGTIAMLYTGVSAGGTEGGADGILYLEMVVLGGVLAGVSGAGPALRATAISPVDTLRERVGSWQPSRAWAGAGLAAMALGTILSFAPPVGSFPFLGYAAGVLFIAGFGLLSPFMVRAIMAAARRPLLALFPTEGRLAVETIGGRLPRVVVALVSLSIAVAMLASVAIMVASFRDTVVVWVDQTLEGDLYMRPAASGGDGGRNTMAPQALAALEGVAGIAAVDRFRGVAIDYDGYPAVLGSGEFETLARHSRLLFMNGEETSEVAAQLIDQDRVVVSEPFAVRHGVATGDSISLPTPEGLVEFEVAGVFYDYSNEGGMVVMDRTTWVKRLDDAVSTVAVYLEPGTDPDAVRRAIADRLDGASTRIATNGELRGQVLRVFDQTFEVTYALEVIALAVAVMGIANTLAALILERREEMAMLRFIGASRVQIRRVILMESGLVGLLGGLIGLALGVVLSLLLVYVINFQSFGWTIQFALPAGFLLQAMVVVFLATLASGLYPAALALRMDPIEGIRAE